MDAAMDAATKEKVKFMKYKKFMFDKKVKEAERIVEAEEFMKERYDDPKNDLAKNLTKAEYEQQLYDYELQQNPIKIPVRYLRKLKSKKRN